MNENPLTKRDRLRLYIAGPAIYANRAKQGLAEAALVAVFEYDLEVVDLCAAAD